MVVDNQGVTPAVVRNEQNGMGEELSGPDYAPRNSQLYQTKGLTNMSTQTMQIVKLPALRVASAWAFGPQPEPQAWQVLEEWAQKRGLLHEGARIFGFNNPNPAPGSPNYGYEFWLEIGADVTPGADDKVRVADFAGGLYAMIEVDVTGDLNVTIPAAWRTLDSQVAESAYHAGTHQWLEQHTPAGAPFAFYFPIVE